MTEQTQEKKPLTLSGKLELKKPVEGNKIRQNLSGTGKSKLVQVEVRKKRVIQHPGTAPKVNLTEDAEKANRLKVLQAALKAEEEAKLQAQEEEKRLREQEEAAARQAAEAEKAAKIAEEAEKAAQATQEESSLPVSEPVSIERTANGEIIKEMASGIRTIASTKKAKTTPEKDMSGESKSASRREKEEEAYEWKASKHRDEREAEEKEMAAPRKPRFQEEKRRSGKVNVFSVMNSDDEDEDGMPRRRRSLASIKRRAEKEKMKQMAAQKPAEKVVRDVIIPETITVQELANRMAERGADVIKTLMKLGMMVTITQTIDADTAQLVAEEFGHKVHRVAESDIEDVLKREEDKAEDMRPRSPVVTVMGHVDHGKTSLLDALRSTRVAEGEAGGITQHIGAYQIEMPTGQKVTFIDTPGHEAFTQMRARGAQVTDIVILVVAANDGVMPQTIEAINHAHAAGVPIVVAINKIDLPGADPNKVRSELLNYGVIVESMGGDVLSVEVSAKKRMNLDKLVEAVLLQAEVLDLKANPNTAAKGAVIEARMEKGRGPVATVLVQNGTLKTGDVFVSGQEWGRVRSLFNDKGQKTDKALPSVPVEVIGLQGVPSAGDDFIVVEDENKAREVSNYRTRKAREALQVKSKAGTLMEQMVAKIKAGEMKELPVVVKGDVQGSVEALIGTLNKIANEEVRIRVLHAGVGGINESDVTLARASNATIIGFNVRANPQAREMAHRDGVDIRYYSIIYDVAEDMKKAVEGMLTPELKEKIIGYAEIRQVFNISKVGKIAGCMVTEGMVKRGAKVRLLRDNVVIYEGALSQLKRMKDDVREVKEGFDCGMRFDNYDDIKVGDQIECYEVEEIQVHLDIKV